MSSNLTLQLLKGTNFGVSKISILSFLLSETLNVELQKTHFFFFLTRVGLCF